MGDCLYIIRCIRFILGTHFEYEDVASKKPFAQSCARFEFQILLGGRVPHKYSFKVVLNSLRLGKCHIVNCLAWFQLGQFTDDRHCSRLRTLLCHYPATQVGIA